MTLFKLLIQSTGLSTREAARFLDVSLDSVKSWSSGRNNCPSGVLEELCDLMEKQNAAALAALDVINNRISDTDFQEIEIGYCVDDHEAQGLGWPCKSAHDAVIRRIVEYADDDIIERLILVPRGSTLSSAAAELKQV